MAIISSQGENIRKGQALFQLCVCITSGHMLYVVYDAQMA